MSHNLTLILDLTNTTLSFERNGVSAGICFDDIVRKLGVEYRLALTLYASETVELLDYKEE